MPVECGAREVRSFFLESLMVLLPMVLGCTLPLLRMSALTWPLLCALLLTAVLAHTAWRIWHRREVRAFGVRRHVPVWTVSMYPLHIPSVADFDSATAFLRATALALRGSDFPHLGRPPMPLEDALGYGLNCLPEQPRTFCYSIAGGMEATPERSAGQLIDGDRVAQAVVRQYVVDTRYPTVAIGSSSGALLHVYAAMQMPWLPQTLLFPIRRSLPRKGAAPASPG